MIDYLPGQIVLISNELRNMLHKIEALSPKKIVFSGSPATDFIGRTEWRDNDILVEVQADLTHQMAEYVAGHELGHVLQLIRNCAIAAGRLDEPDAVVIATMVTDFVLDSSADSIACEYGLHMATPFQNWLQSTSLIDAFQNPRHGRIFGDNWHRIWERMTEARVRKQLGLVTPKFPRDFWTMYVSLDLAKVCCRASNLGLSIGEEIKNTISKTRLLAKIVNDLIQIGSATSIEESEAKIETVLEYFETEPGHIQIYKPLSGDFLIEGKWQKPPIKQENPMDKIIEDNI